VGLYRMQRGETEVNCWVCNQDKICLPYRSNPKGIAEGAIFNICSGCRARIDALPEKP